MSVPCLRSVFKHTVMSREDIDNENRMTHLLQFFSSEAKEAVCRLETVA